MLGELRLAGRHLPAALVVAGKLLQACLLVLLGHVEPELDDERAVLNQHALEVDDAVQLGVQLGVCAVP